MERFWRGVGFHLGKRWYVVAIGVVALTAALAPGLGRLEFATGQDSYLNPGSQVAVDNERFQAAFGGEAIVLLFDLADGRTIDDLFTPANVERLARFEDELRALPEVASVITPLTSLRWSEAIASGPGSAALISAAERETDPAAKQLRQDDLATSLARLGAVGERDVANPAWVEFLLYANAGFADGAREIRPSLLSTFPDRDTAVGGVVLKGNATLDELSSGTESVLAVVQRLELEHASLLATGSPVYLKEINDYLQEGMLTLGAIALAVMAVVLLVMFRVRWRLLPLLAVLIGITWSFALLGYLGIALSLVTISGLPILIGMGIDFAIQVHNRVEEEVVLDHEEHPISETTANLIPPLLLAVAAAVVAFLALRVSRVPMIRDFGVLLAVGIVVLLAVGVVVPVAVLGAREWHRRTASRRRSITEWLVVKLGALSTRAVPVIAVLAVVLVVLGVSWESRTKIQSDPIRWIDQDSQVVRDVGTLEAETGFATTLGILVEANNVLAPEVSTALTEFVFAAEARPDVAVTSSLVGTMAKVIAVPGTPTLAPTSADLQAALAVAPPDIARALVGESGVAAQVNLRLGPASLEERAVLVRELEDQLATLFESVPLTDDTVLTDGLAPGVAPIRAVPSGLAVVGVGLLENLRANRTTLTYLALAAAALLLVLRFRSLTRAALTLVPVVLAVGASSAIVSGLGITLSPMTTVSGPLVIASCVEFAVLITARYLEERQRGLEAREATDTASARTGRAFFTSAATTVGGFATLVFSPLPLLRDFGIIVTLNVSIALLAALVAMPPLLVFADRRGWIQVDAREPGSPRRSVRLAAPAAGRQFAAAVAAAVVLAGAVGLLLADAQVQEAKAAPLAYTATPLPTTTTTTTTVPPEGPPEIDPADYGTDRPATLIGGALFDLLTAQGVPANQAVCTAEVLLSRTTEQALLDAGIASFTDEALEPVIAAGLDCKIPQADIDRTIAAARGQ